MKRIWPPNSELLELKSFKRYSMSSMLLQLAGRYSHDFSFWFINAMDYITDFLIWANLIFLR
jgi:hypothetical protein